MSRYVVTRISNNDAAKYVTNRDAFKGSNLFGEWVLLRPAGSRRDRFEYLETIEAAHREIYVVYSYGEHWPLFVFDPVGERWYENGDRYSMKKKLYPSKSFNTESPRNKFSVTTDQHHRCAHPAANTILCDVATLKRIIEIGAVMWMEIQAEKEARAK